MLYYILYHPHGFTAPSVQCLCYTTDFITGYKLRFYDVNGNGENFYREGEGVTKRVRGGWKGHRGKNREGGEQGGPEPPWKLYIHG